MKKTILWLVVIILVSVIVFAVGPYKTIWNPYGGHNQYFPSGNFSGTTVYGVNCDQINFSGTIGSAGICDGLDATGGGGASAFFVAGSYISPNITETGGVDDLNVSTILLNNVLLVSGNASFNQSQTDNLYSNKTHSLNGTVHYGNLSSARVVKDTGTNYLTQLLDAIIDALFDRLTAISGNIATNRTASESALRTNLDDNITLIHGDISGNITASESVIRTNIDGNKTEIYGNLDNNITGVNTKIDSANSAITGNRTDAEIAVRTNIDGNKTEIYGNLDNNITGVNNKISSATSAITGNRTASESAIRTNIDGNISMINSNIVNNLTNETIIRKDNTSSANITLCDGRLCVNGSFVMIGSSNQTKSSYHNITDLPTCAGTEKFTYDGTTLSCAIDATGAGGGVGVFLVAGSYISPNLTATGGVDDLNVSTILLNNVLLVSGNASFNQSHTDELYSNNSHSLNGTTHYGNLSADRVTKNTGTNYLTQFLDSIIDALFDRITAISNNIAGNRTASESAVRTNIDGNKTEIYTNLDNNITGVSNKIASANLAISGNITQVNSNIIANVTNATIIRADNSSSANITLCNGKLCVNGTFADEAINNDLTIASTKAMNTSSTFAVGVTDFNVSTTGNIESGGNATVNGLFIGRYNSTHWRIG